MTWEVVVQTLVVLFSLAFMAGRMTARLSALERDVAEIRRTLVHLLLHDTPDKEG
jgi:hypothetical protein